MNAINDKHRKLNNEWDQALGYASGELKRRADPLRTVDLGDVKFVSSCIICHFYCFGDLTNSTVTTLLSGKSAAL